MLGSFQEVFTQFNGDVNHLGMGKCKAAGSFGRRRLQTPSIVLGFV